MSDPSPTIVIDAGSHTVKAGYAGDAEPRAVFPTRIGNTSPFPPLTVVDRFLLMLGNPVIRDGN